MLVIERTAAAPRRAALTRTGAAAPRSRSFDGLGLEAREEEKERGRPHCATVLAEAGLVPFSAHLRGEHGGSNRLGLVVVREGNAGEQRRWVDRGASIRYTRSYQ